MFSQNNDKSTPPMPYNISSQAAIAPTSKMSVIAKDLKIGGKGMRIVDEHALLIDGEIH